MTRYRFLTTWVLESPVGPIWDAIYDTDSWPGWWPGVTRVVELAPRGPDGVGGLSRFTFRSRLPYDLEFDMRSTRVERPHLMEGSATGELDGVGRWRFFEGAGTTAVTYEWNVGTTRRWMNAIAPLARPVFAWNHDHVMRGGGEGLATLLGVRMLAAD